MVVNDFLYGRYTRTVLLLPMFLISPFASPSCFTPMVQQRAGGFDAIVSFVLGFKEGCEKKGEE